MANLPISGLSAGSAVADTDLFPDVQTVGVGPVKVTGLQIKTYTSTSPTLVTPTLGVADGTSLALGGATIGSNALAVTGTTSLGITTGTSLALGGATIGSNALAVTGTSLMGSATYFPDGSASAPSIAHSGDTNCGFYFGTDTIYASTAGFARLTLDSSGNLGLGVTPSAWDSSFPAFQVGKSAFWTYISDNRTAVGSNVFVGSGPDAKYIANGYASQYYQAAGQHLWLTAASGTAGGTISFTQAMTLDASGNLAIGTTTPITTLGVNGTGITLKKSDTGISNWTVDRQVAVTGGGAAVAILTGAYTLGGIAIVSGGVSGVSSFTDIICWAYSTVAAPLATFDIVGSPGARTYTAAYGQLSVAIAGSGSYLVAATAISMAPN